MKRFKLSVVVVSLLNHLRVKKLTRNWESVSCYWHYPQAHHGHEQPAQWGPGPLSCLPVGLAAGTVSLADPAFIPLGGSLGRSKEHWRSAHFHPHPPPKRGRKGRGRRSLPVRCLRVHLPPSLPVAFQFESKKEYSLFIDYFK